MSGWRKFQQSRVPADLEKSINELTAIVNVKFTKTSEYVVKRRSMVQAWGTILKTIEDNIDPTFDPHDDKQLPVSCLTPPDPHIVTCFDYQDIHDPKEHAKFIEEIHENDLKRQRVDFQGRLVYLDGLAMTFLESDLYVYRQYYGVPDDTPALEEILRKTGITNVRLQKIDLMLRSKSTNPI